MSAQIGRFGWALAWVLGAAVWIACGAAGPSADAAAASDAPAAMDGPDGAAMPADDAAADAPEAAGDAGGDGAFVVGAHASLRPVPNQGGPVMAHPLVVTITFANDPNRDALEAYDRWLVGSSWLRTTGAEYGVGAGSAQAARRAEDAPDVLLGTEIVALIAQGIADGSLPRAADGTLRGVVYAVFVPARTRVSLQSHASGTVYSCESYTGFHEEATTAAGAAGERFAYAVIAACGGQMGLSDLESEELVAGHEIFEAATDPLPDTNPAWAFGADSNSPWLPLGGEIADLCALPDLPTREDGHIAPRVWSNAAARAGDQDPCVPADPAHPYYGVSVDPDAIQTVGAGASVDLALQAWTTAPGRPFHLSATAASAGFRPGLSLSASTLNNGDSATLTVRVPAGTPSGSHAIVYLAASRSTSDYRIWPVAVQVE